MNYLKWEGGSDYRYAFGPGISAKDFFYQVIGSTGTSPYHSKVVKLRKSDMVKVAEWTSVVTCDYGEGSLIFAEGKLFVSNAGYSGGRIDEIDPNTMIGTGRFWDDPLYCAAWYMTYFDGHIYFSNNSPHGDLKGGFFKLRLSDMSVVASFCPSNKFAYRGVKFDSGSLYVNYRDDSKYLGYVAKLRPTDMSLVGQVTLVGKKDDSSIWGIKDLTILGNNIYSQTHTNHNSGHPFKVFKVDKTSMTLQGTYTSLQESCESIDNDGSSIYVASSSGKIETFTPALDLVGAVPIGTNQISISDGFAYCTVESANFATIYKVPLSEFGGVTPVPVPTPIPIPVQDIAGKLAKLKAQIVSSIDDMIAGVK